MPRAALSEPEIRAFRERVIEAATGLFADSGFDAVTLRAIAAEVGCSPMTPYRYFADKDEIFALVRAAAFRRFADMQQAAIADVDDPLEALFELARAYRNFADAEPDGYRIIFELRRRPHSEHPELLAEGDRAWGYMHASVARAVDAGVLNGSVDRLAAVLWAGVHGVVSLFLSDSLRPGQSVDELFPDMMAALFVGLGGSTGTEEN